MGTLILPQTRILREVADTRFKFHRVIRGQNSFVPVIAGSFRPRGLGSVMTINMRLIWSVTIFCIGIVSFLAWNSIDVDSRLAGPRQHSDGGGRDGVVHLSPRHYLLRYRGTNRYATSPGADAPEVSRCGQSISLAMERAKLAIGKPTALLLWCTRTRLGVEASGGTGRFGTLPA